MARVRWGLGSRDILLGRSRGRGEALLSSLSVVEINAWT
jgi:hypothetical protein